MCDFAQKQPITILKLETMAKGSNAKLLSISIRNIFVRRRLNDSKLPINTSQSASRTVNRLAVVVSSKNMRKQPKEKENDKVNETHTRHLFAVFFFISLSHLFVACSLIRLHYLCMNFFLFLLSSVIFLLSIVQLSFIPCFFFFIMFCFV